MKRGFNVFFMPLALATILLNGCLNDDTEKRKDQHDIEFEQLKNRYGFTEEENIGDDIYVKITDIPVNQIKPGEDDYIIVDYIARDAQNKIYDLTDEQVARDNNLYRADVVYGPLRVPVKSTFSGFFKAVQHVPQSSDADMLFPHDQAFYDYNPIVYEMHLYRVIRNIEVYDSLQMLTYMNALDYEFETFRMGPADVFYSVLTEGTDSVALEDGDSVKIKIYGYYVEADDSYVDSIPGRQFFPINDSGDEISFVLGEKGFPVTKVVEQSLYDMKVGETRAIISPANYTYGNNGFVHPYISVFIIPPHMPLHYEVTLLSYRKNE